MTRTDASAALPAGLPAGSPDVSPWLAGHAALLPAAAQVLDLACGWGRNARWLAAQGHQVLAVDRDVEALASMAGVAGVTTLCADLEGAPWPLADAQFDAVLVCRYLHRPLFPHVFAAVKPGGLLVYETFMQGNERFGRPARPEFLLAPGELVACVREAGWQLLAAREGEETLAAGGPAEPPRQAMTQAIVARRPH
jgi:SAM-dependent methyltransferase